MIHMISMLCTYVVRRGLLSLKRQYPWIFTAAAHTCIAVKNPCANKEPLEAVRQASDMTCCAGVSNRAHVSDVVTVCEAKKGRLRLPPDRF